MAFSCTVESTITRSNSAGLIAFMPTAASIVVFSNGSTPASPSTRRKHPICVASHGSRASKYWLSLKNCKYTSWTQRSTTDSLLPP